MNPMGPMDESGSTGYDATLRLIAHAPVPRGLEERLQAALQRSPREARVLAWPSVRPMIGWARAVAAAGIVAVVAGGGWGVYHHAQLHSAAGVAQPPVTAPAKSGFATAGAVRTPETVQGPAAIDTTVPAQRQPLSKAPQRSAPSPAK